jgi:hypothetical protein
LAISKILFRFFEILKYKFYMFKYKELHVARSTLVHSRPPSHFTLHRNGNTTELVAKGNTTVLHRIGKVAQEEKKTELETAPVYIAKLQHPGTEAGSVLKGILQQAVG